GAGGQVGEGQDLLQVDRDGHEEQAGQGGARSYFSDKEVLPRGGGVGVHRAGWPAAPGPGGSGGPTTVVAWRALMAVSASRSRGWACMRGAASSKKAFIPPGTN